MTTQPSSLQQLLKLLLRYHRRLGLNHQQYVLLHSCIQFDDMDILVEVTGLPEEEIMKSLMDLANRKVITFTPDKNIDLEHLRGLLSMIALDDIPFRELLVKEFVNQKKQKSKHIGHVELVPMSRGIAVRMRNGTYLPIARLKELTEEFSLFAESIKDEEIWNVNLHLLSQLHHSKDESINKIV